MSVSDVVLSPSFLAYTLGTLLALAGQVATDVQIAKRYTIPRMRAQVNADVEAKLELLERRLAGLIDHHFAELRATVPAAPSAEELQASRNELANAISETVQLAVPGAVQAAVGEAVKARMGALSERAVDARGEKATMEWALKQAVANHPKGGLPAVFGLAAVKKADKDWYNAALEAFALKPEAIDDFMEKHGAKLSLGFGGKAAKQVEPSRVVRG